MIKAILLDLDNTLLHNPDDIFAIEYLRATDSYCSQRWNYQYFSDIVRHILPAHHKPREPQQTNAMLSVGIVSQMTGRTPEEVLAWTSDFYREVYPALQHCTQPIDGAAELVAFLKAQDYDVAIITNPIYPAEAIYQRLKWAGLDDNPEAYAFISHAENMHFAKPHPAYYAEVLARIGIEPDEAIMVGDSLTNDIEPAAMLGIHTYQIVSELLETLPDTTSLPSKGTLQDFYTAMLNCEWMSYLSPNQPSPPMIEPQLRGNVAALFGMLDEVKPHFWSQHPDPNEWSILQIVCHLLESETAVQRPRLAQILKEDNPFLATPKPPPGPQHLHCDGTGEELAHRFATARQKTIDFLHTLQPDDWYRPARHSIFGPTSLVEMAHFTAQHDRLHLNQLCQTLGKCE